MSCEECRLTLEKDGAEPDCFDGSCKIPPLDEAGNRIMEIRRKLITLQDLVDPGTILKMYEATPADIELLAVVEEELEKLKPQETPDSEP